jgi:hypothetical protein
MPLINGKYYANPAFGRAVEAARAAEEERPDENNEGGRWVTIDGHHVLLNDTQAKRQPQLSVRDKAYFDKYYDAVAAFAKRYNVDPALVLGVGIESGFASEGTYLRTGDAFGMTGGNTKHMTTAESPEQNVKQFFENYGNQIRGTGNDESAFMNGLQGVDASGKRVRGWKVYNNANPKWRSFIGGGIDEMRRDIPSYLSERKAGRVGR